MMTTLGTFKTRHGSSEKDPFHEHKGSNRVGCTVNPVTITLFICRSNRSEVRQLCFSPFMIGVCSFRIHSSSPWVLYWYHGTDERNRKSTWISIQIMQFALQGLLATESQFWEFPPLYRLLFLQLWLLDSWVQTIPIFLHDLQSFLEKLRAATCPPSFMFLIYKWKW